MTKQNRDRNKMISSLNFLIETDHIGIEKVPNLILKISKKKKKKKNIHPKQEKLVRAIFLMTKK